MTGPVLGFKSHQDHTGSPRNNQDRYYMILANFDPQTFSKTPSTFVRSNPGILEPPGSHRITQDQFYMILAFLAPQTFSKTPPTCVRYGPGIPEPPLSHRAPQDQPGPVLHDPFFSCSSDLFKNTSYLCQVRSLDPRATRITQDQSFMTLAFLNPHNFSKTPLTSVRSGPGILEPPGPQRIT